MKADDYPERIYVNDHNSGMYKDWGAEPLETEHIGNVVTMQYDNIEYIRADLVPRWRTGDGYKNIKPFDSYLMVLEGGDMIVCWNFNGEVYTKGGIKVDNIENAVWMEIKSFDEL